LIHLSHLHFSFFTFHSSRLTFHVSRLMSHVSRLTSHASRLTFDVSRSFTIHFSLFSFHFSLKKTLTANFRENPIVSRYEPHLSLTYYRNPLHMKRQLRPSPSLDITIDIKNTDQLHYVAARFGCTVDEVVLAIQTTRSGKRSIIYGWLFDYIFKGCS